MRYLSDEMTHLIIGIDPGLTTAFAAVDLRGNFVSTFSKKEMRADELAKAITEVGKPLIFAVDKSNAPDAAKKLAASFNCRLFAPREDLKVVHKNSLVKEMLSVIENNNGNSIKLSVHEKDALAAAIVAYKAHATEFSKIDDTLSSLGLAQHGDAAKRMIVKGEVKNIAEAVNRLVSEQKPAPKPQPVPPAPKQISESKKVRDLENSLYIQKAYIAKIEERLKSSEKSRQQLVGDQLRQSEEARKKVLEQKEIAVRENLISGMKKQMEELKKQTEALQIQVARHDEVEQIMAEDCVPVVPVKEYTREALAEADRMFKIKDKVIWIQEHRPSNATTKFLIALSPRVVLGKIGDAARDKLIEAGIGVADCTPKQRHIWAHISEKDLLKSLTGEEKKSFMRWLEAYKMREA